MVYYEGVTPPTIDEVLLAETEEDLRVMLTEMEPEDSSLHHLIRDGGIESAFRFEVLKVTQAQRAAEVVKSLAIHGGNKYWLPTLIEIIQEGLDLMTGYIPRLVPNNGFKERREAWLKESLATATVALPEWVELIYEAVANNQIDDAMGELFNNMEDLYLENRFSECDEILQALDLSKLNDDLLVGLIMVTHQAADDLKYRSTLITRVIAAMELIMPKERVLAILRQTSVLE